MIEFFFLEAGCRGFCLQLLDVRFDLVVVWEPVKHHVCDSVVADGVEPFASLPHVFECRSQLFLKRSRFGIRHRFNMFDVKSKRAA